MLYTSRKFEDYLLTLSSNLDYATYVIGELIREGKNGELNSTIGAAHIVEIEDVLIGLIDHVQNLRGKRQ
jgi:hypothetical protein